MTSSPSSDLPTNKRDWLILIPTRFEFEFVQKQLPPDFDEPIEICGFGPIVPAAQTVQLIRNYQPARVLLLGIAGSYSEILTVGSAFPFLQVGCYGVGVGSGDTFQTAETMGWPHWLGDSTEKSIGDIIPLAPLTDPQKGPKRLQLVQRVFRENPKLLLNMTGQFGADDERCMSPLLITATSAAENATDVDNRLNIFPEALAEDMEGFGVAAACQLCDVPLFIVRGISNHAGDRDKRNWKISEALTAAVRLSREVIRCADE